MNARSLSNALILRQLLNTLRNPRGLWFLGVALLTIAGGFTVSFHASIPRYHSAFEMERSAFGLPLLDTFYWFCLYALLLFVPLIGVNAIAQERESDTLDMLLTTPMRPFTLVLSKVIVSMAQILFALIGTLPILSQTYMMGGVGPIDLIQVFLSLLIATFFALSLGMWAGARARSMVRGLAAVYVTGAILGSILYLYYLIGYYALWSIFRGNPSTNPPLMTFIFVTTHVPVIFVSLFFFFLTPASIRKEFPKTRPRTWRPPRMKGIDSQLWTLLGVREYGEPIAETSNPVYVCERERFLGQVIRRWIDAPSLIWIFSATVMAIVTVRSEITMLTFTLYTVVLFTPIVGANAFSREREQETWDPLRTALLAGKRILNGKLRLCIGQALIHAAAMFFPALPIIAIVWVGAATGSNGGVGVFVDENAAPFWGMLALFIPIIAAMAISAPVYPCGVRRYSIGRSRRSPSRTP